MSCRCPQSPACSASGTTPISSTSGAPRRARRCARSCAMRSPWQWPATCPRRISASKSPRRRRRAPRKSCATTTRAGAACRATTSRSRRSMKERFTSLSGALERTLKGGETLLCNVSAERSDFVRFNQALVRQAGSVEQCYLTLRLARERRQAQATVALAGNTEDLDVAKAALSRLRDSLAGLPADPLFLINEEPHSTSTERRGTLAPAPVVVDQALEKARGRDMVGFYAGGTMYRGFANSLGQRNWHEVDSFNFDWSLYKQGDQAVKTSYAGFDWDAGAFAQKMVRAAEEVELLAAPRRTLEPGLYRAYLAPAAMAEVMSMLSWGGFSVRARQTKQSPLLAMQEGRTLSGQVTIVENVAEGIAPAFQGQGFLKPPRIELIREGRLGDPLVSPRSAKEYGL